jgi:branched-chain amino acid transport system ATP-binding protein
MTRPTPLLSLEDVHVDYEGIISALRGVSLDVHDGEIVALLGSNGAGKTTTLKAASALLEAERGAITRGAVRFADLPPRRLTPRGLAQAGLVQVLEGRRCFSHLSVHENLVSGTLARRTPRAQIDADIARIYELFPRLKERVSSSAGFLSGGEQQMLAIGRALMLRPRLLLLDEPSIGLAPQIVREIFDAIAELNRRDGLSVLIAEQNARAAASIAHRAVVLENGRVALTGSAAELSRHEDIQHFYLGHAASEQGRLEALKATLRAERASG